ncbi:MAG: hypothetical protein JO141_10920 [Bradyrhizobium sp.]|nr:hypothetical protein [Bradyrhizobium sp.]
MNDGSNHCRIRVAAGPDDNAIDLNLDTRAFWLGFASPWLALWDDGRGRCVDHSGYKIAARPPSQPAPGALAGAR